MNKFMIFQFLLLASLCWVQADHSVLEDEELDPTEVEEPGCPKIYNLAPIHHFKEMMGEWNLPYMSDHWIRYMAKSMHGRNMNKASLSRACVKITVKPMPDGKSYNNASIWIHSKCPRTGAEFNLGCEPSAAVNSKLFCTDLTEKAFETKMKGDSHVYILGSAESEDYALVVRCFPKNGMNWAILTKSKVLDQKIVKDLLGQVKIMGFDLKNVIEVPYEKCRY